jgi:acyl-coenzyme A thioesterase PaaI-like protein
MSATIKSDEVLMTVLQERMHTECILCGAAHPQGLRLCFSVHKDGHVEAPFACPRNYQGYTGHLHGGVISALLDSAMTNCLFAQGRVGMTGELKVRFFAPVDVDTPAVINAWLVESHGPLYCLRSELTQEGTIRARATAKFMEVPAAKAVGESPA